MVILDLLLWNINFNMSRITNIIILIWFCDIDSFDPFFWVRAKSIEIGSKSS